MARSCTGSSSTSVSSPYSSSSLLHFALAHIECAVSASGGQIQRKNICAREEGERVAECGGERVRRPIGDRTWAAAWDRSHVDGAKANTGSHSKSMIWRTRRPHKLRWFEVYVGRTRIAQGVSLRTLDVDCVSDAQAQRAPLVSMKKPVGDSPAA